MNIQTENSAQTMYTDQMPQDAASDQGLHCFAIHQVVLRHIHSEN